MNRARRAARLLALPCIAAWVAACAATDERLVTPLGREVAAPAPPPAPPASPYERLDGFLPDVLLTTHDGRSVHFASELVHGRCVLVNFMYTRCTGICPGVTANLVQVQRALGDFVGDELLLVSISLDGSAVDTPEVLADYARACGAGPGWLFLTGEVADVEALRHRLGVDDPDPEIDRDKTQHAGMLVCINEPRGLWTGISGLQSPTAIVDSVMRTMRRRWERTPPVAGTLPRVSSAPAAFATRAPLQTAPGPAPTER